MSAPSGDKEARTTFGLFSKIRAALPLGGRKAQPSKYEEGEPPEWVDGLAKLKAELVGAEIKISGECPRCHPHDINYAAKPQSGATAAPNLPPGRFVLTCTCKEGHPDTPPGKSGCGARGVVHLAGEKVLPSAATDEEMAANAWAVEAIKERCRAFEPPPRSGVGLSRLSLVSSARALSSRLTRRSAHSRRDGGLPMVYWSLSQSARRLAQLRWLRGRLSILT